MPKRKTGEVKLDVGRVLFDHEDPESRPSTQGLNREQVRLESWNDGEYKMYTRREYFRQASGEWIPRKAGGTVIEDIRFIHEHPEWTAALLEQWDELNKQAAQRRGDAE
jgi:hypothetical protein